MWQTWQSGCGAAAISARSARWNATSRARFPVARPVFHPHANAACPEVTLHRRFALPSILSASL